MYEVYIRIKVKTECGLKRVKNILKNYIEKYLKKEEEEECLIHSVVDTAWKDKEEENEDIV